MRKKSLLLIIITTLALSACSGVEGNNSTPAEFGKLIFSALKDNKPEVYNQYIYTEEDIREILNSFDGTPEEKEDLGGYMLENVEDITQRIKEAFPKIRNRAEERGLTDWSEFEFKRTTFKHLQKPGVNYAQFVKIEFASPDYTGQIELFRFMETKRGWVIVSVPEFKFLKPNNLFKRS